MSIQCLKNATRFVLKHIIRNTPLDMYISIDLKTHINPCSMAVATTETNIQWWWLQWID
jgi:hypothetical protein